MTSTCEELMTRLLLTREETAWVLSIAPESVTYLLRMKSLPAVKVGKELRWKPSAVKAFVEGLEEDGR